MNHKILHIFTVVAVTIALFGCIREDRTACSELQQIRVDIKTEYPGSLPSDKVKDAQLYIFDKTTRHFIELIRLSKDQIDGKSSVLIKHKNRDLHIVVWGNLHQEGLEPITIGSNSTTENITINLKANLDGLHSLPPDLFHGQQDIVQGSSSKVSISVNTAISGISVNLIGLRQWVGTTSDDKDFSVVIRNTGNSMDFNSNTIATDAILNPPLKFDDITASTGKINVIPSLEINPPAVAIDIYHAGVRKITIDKDSNNRYLRSVRGMVMNVSVDFRSNVSVSVVITDWNHIEQNS